MRVHPTPAVAPHPRLRLEAETAAPLPGAASEGVPPTRPSGREVAMATSAAHPAHHIKQHLGINLDAAPSATEAMPAAMAEHLAGINEVLAAIIARPLLGVAERLVRLANVLEAVGGLLVVGVLVRVVDDGEAAVGLLDRELVRVLLDAQDRVVVLALALLELELRIAHVLGDAGLRRVGLGDGLPLSRGFFPVAGLAQRARFGLAGFDVRGVEGQRAGAVCDGGIEGFQLEGLLVCVPELR